MKKSSSEKRNKKTPITTIKIIIGAFYSIILSHQLYYTAKLLKIQGGIKMNYEVEIESKNGINVVSSRVVAKQLDKRHTDVLRDIDIILEKSDLTFLKNSENADLRSLIIPSNYQVKGQKRNYKE